MPFGSTVFVLAGPNGAGKTSLYYHEAPNVPRVNGDTLLHEGHAPQDVEAILRQQLEELTEQRASFIIETNAAAERDYALLASLKKSGYRIECRYVGLESVRMCLQRVAQRVAQGGHDVPPAFIQHRYENGLSLLKANYRLFDRLQLYDNSAEQPEKVADFIPGMVPRLFSLMPAWATPVVIHITKMEALYAKLHK